MRSLEEFPLVELSWVGKRRTLPACESVLSQPGRAGAAPMPTMRAPDGSAALAENLLVFGDNLQAMLALRAAGLPPVTLVYLDPPFFTGKAHTLQGARKLGGARSGRSGGLAFDDRWKDLGEFLQTLRDRLVAARELLAEHGCLVVHVDPKTSHYIRVLGEEVFGAGCFASEIIWRYRRWPAKTQNFQRVHDVLLRFVKNPSLGSRFNQLYEPLAPSTRAVWGTRKQRAVLGQDGDRLRSSTTAEQSPGTPLGDVWEIGILAPVSRERTGYPTQKPEALLERIVLACSNPGEIVVDPYAGSGTTLAVAARLGRRFVGIDASPHALEISRARLHAHGHRPHEVVCTPQSVEAPPTADDARGADARGA